MFTLPLRIKNYHRSRDARLPAHILEWLRFLGGGLDRWRSAVRALDAGSYRSHARTGANQTGDVVYDIGSGDGAIVIAAAKKYGVRGVGIEIDQDLVLRARDNAFREKVEHLVEFRAQDAFTVDMSPATVVTLYMLPEFNAKLRPILQRQLKARHPRGLARLPDRRMGTRPHRSCERRLLFTIIRSCCSRSRDAGRLI